MSSFFTNLKTFPALLIMCALVYVFIIRRYVPIFTGTIGTVFGIALVPIVSLMLEELLLSKEDKVFIEEFELELRDQFCGLRFPNLALAEKFVTTNKVCSKHKLTASPHVWNDHCEPDNIQLQVEMFLKDNPTHEICDDDP